MTFPELIKEGAEPAQRVAIEELEKRGFELLVHFGTENAVEVLDEMNIAAKYGCLYEYLQVYLGVTA